MPGCFFLNRKHLCQIHYCNKVSDLKPPTALKYRLPHICFSVIFENSWWHLLKKDLQTAAFGSWQYFRNCHRTCSVRESVLRRLATLLKKSLWHRCFLVNFVKYLRTPFLQNTSRRLLLNIFSCRFVSAKKMFWTILQNSQETALSFWIKSMAWNLQLFKKIFAHVYFWELSKSFKSTYLEYLRAAASEIWQFLCPSHVYVVWSTVLPQSNGTNRK